MTAAGPFLERAPHAVPQMLQALDFLLAEPVQVVIAGPPDAPETARMLETVRGRFMPHRVVLAADGGEGQARLARRLPFLEAVEPRAGLARHGPGVPALRLRPAGLLAGSPGRRARRDTGDRLLTREISNLSPIPASGNTPYFTPGFHLT